uniref:2-amino-4-hydroxy-6- hydroxymethyldihydropteridine diphosphokinase n=1 Tax=Parerythrobacter lutipelagi TaxID=1964208 RepID=UPI0010F5E287|nr:2-amino-4-hydroxy-6-hydroxymethyldihydropteridine diphosphokinase [Parerythrobacter lutipelagi]
MHDYLLALGSNQPHAEYGPPRAVIAAAVETVSALGSITCSPVIASLPLGPSLRRYANAAALLETELSPRDLLGALKSIERAFGRTGGGGRWRARVLDLDIVLWSGGIWVGPELAIPHPRFRERTFVLGPAMSIAPGWRDPVTGLSVRQLNARLTKPKPLPR